MLREGRGKRKLKYEEGEEVENVDVQFRARFVPGASRAQRPPQPARVT